MTMTDTMAVNGVSDFVTSGNATVTSRHVSMTGTLCSL